MVKYVTFSAQKFILVDFSPSIWIMTGYWPCVKCKYLDVSKILNLIKLSITLFIDENKNILNNFECHSAFSIFCWR